MQKPKKGEKRITYLFSLVISNKTTYCYFAEEPETGIDPVCYRANGFFNHEDPAVCDK